jgi:transcriptional regulator with XRE-family HTH domain
MQAGVLIREARRGAGLSRAELARRLGTSRSALARWEAGAVSPRLSTLERLLRACGLAVEVQARPDAADDRDQIAERLSWTPKQRLDYLADMVAFEERAARTRRAVARPR